MDDNIFVGKEIEKYKNNADGTQFDLNDEGAMLTVLLPHPNNKEIQQFYSSKFKVRAILLSNVVWMTFKFGALDWMDAPFSVHLCKVSDKNRLMDYLSKPLRIMIIDTETGRVTVIMKIDWSDSFINQLCCLMVNSYVMPYDRVL